jgi:hypothetical protein
MSPSRDDTDRTGTPRPSPSSLGPADEGAFADRDGKAHLRHVHQTHERVVPVLRATNVNPAAGESSNPEFRNALGSLRARRAVGAMAR